MSGSDQDNVDFTVFGREIESFQRSLPKGGGGGTSDGMDAQIQRLDDKIDNRFFWLLGTFGAGFLILMSAFAAGFLALSSKIDGVSDQVSQVGQRVAKLEGAAEAKPPPVTAPAPAK